MVNNDFASLCVLSFNRPEMIVHTINQLHEKSGHPFELIVHDDGSDISVQERLLDLNCRGDISTLILNQPGHNQGQGIALNRMFQMAKGDPIVKLDQDLVYEDGWLATAVDLIATNKHAPREQNLGLLGLVHYYHEPVDSAKTRIEQFDGWSSRTHILGSGFAVTRECWEWLKPFEEHSDAFAEDWIFQKAVTASHDFACGLPDSDLATNPNMGPGPSTVVLPNGFVQTIHHEPVIF